MRLEIVLVIRTSEPTPTRGVDVDTIERRGSSPSKSRPLTDAHEEVLLFQYS